MRVWVFTNYESRCVSVMICFELNEFQMVSNYVIRCKSYENVCFAFTLLPHFGKQTTWDCAYYVHRTSYPKLVQCIAIAWSITKQKPKFIVLNFTDPSRWPTQLHHSFVQRAYFILTLDAWMLMLMIYINRTV